MEKKIPMTQRGFVSLQEEIKHLKNIQRPNVVSEIAKAREHGDLSENAEYHSAREKQSFIEGRISELEYKISMAEVVDVTKLNGDTIKFGATVELSDDDTDEIYSYQIVGSDEADVKKGYLSITSPLAKTLIGKKVGSSVELHVPSGVKSYLIKKISFI